jgi:alkaline phosphatase
VLPGAKFYSGDHTNSLVPVYAKGAGSELLMNYVIGTDSNLAALYGLDASQWSGQYIDNTAIYHAMQATLVPEPTTIVLVVLGGAAMLRRRVA